MASSYSGVEMYQKGHVPSVFAQTPRPLSRASDSYETEFEDEDMSDFEEYAGRTSEDSVSRSNVGAQSRLTYPGSLVTEVIRLRLLSKNYELQLQTVSAISISSCH